MIAEYVSLRHPGRHATAQRKPPRANYDVTMPSTPPSLSAQRSRTRRARRLAAGRSGGVFERVPGSSHPHHFQYVQPATSQRADSPVTTRRRHYSLLLDLHAVTDNDSVDDGQKSPLKNTTTSPALSRSPTTNTSATNSAANNIGERDDEASSTATSQLSEHTIATRERPHRLRRCVLHKECVGLRQGSRNGTLQGVQGRQWSLEGEGVGMVQMDDGVREGEVEAVVGAVGGRGAACGRKREEAEEADKASRRFFGLGRKTR